ncbi:MAG: glycoside hydrolase, partial [Actinomycetota bacterium]|nr:glycoside hydrolase [Actinomycetota bacterium]
TDDGKTWDGTAVSTTSPIVDRPWLVGGPGGTLYVSYQDLQCCSPSAIWFLKSTDYGKTFTPAVPVTTFAGQAPSGVPQGPDGAYTWEGNFVVANKGQDVYLVYTRRQSAGITNIDGGGPETVWVAASHDGGTTFNSHLVASMPGPASYLYPSIGLDGAGGLHVVFSSARGNQDHPIWYSYSTDKAEHWTKPVPILTGVAGYSPWIAGGANGGEAAVAWYGSPDPKTTDETESDWYFYTARVSHSGGAVHFTDAGPTTSKPIFHGKQYIPEFEMVRLDSQGNIHIGMSAYWQNPVSKQIHWAVYYQRQKLR